MVKLSIPYLRQPVFRRGALVTFGHQTPSRMSDVQAAFVDRLVRADASLDDLAGIAVEHGIFEDQAAAAEHLRNEYSETDNLVGLADIDLQTEYDMIAIDQGYGGVYVHTVELVEKLRERWRVMLIAPEDPLFEEERHPDDVTVPRLQADDPGLRFFGYTQIVRAILHKVRTKLLFISHRSQSLYLFDLVQKQPTIIYCDGFFDSSFKMCEQFAYDTSEDQDQRILEELHFLLGQTDPQFFGVASGPQVNTALLKAGYAAITRAKENWCWGYGQEKGFQSGFPKLGDTLRFEPPFTDENLFDPERARRERIVLFTTTMHNIDRKGLPELVEAMEKLPDVKVRCVVRQPHLLPEIPPGVRVRMTIGPVKKPEMVDLYHRVWLNCRTSREESSPLSILEAMSCEVPQVTSPVVAEQIPLLEDGKTGFIVDPDDTDRIAHCIRQLLDDQEMRDEMGAECRRRALTYSLGNRIQVFERYLT